MKLDQVSGPSNAETMKIKSLKQSFQNAACMTGSHWITVTEHKELFQLTFITTPKFHIVSHKGKWAEVPSHITT